MTIAYPIAGIDISSTTLDVAMLDAKGRFEALSFANDKASAKKLAKLFTKKEVKLVVLEATGGYEITVMAALAAEAVPAARINPRQVRFFAKGLGKLAKTDAIDARVLALFGERARPRPTELPTAEQSRLAALVLRRRQLVDMRTAEKNRIAKAPATELHSSLRRMIDGLAEEINTIEALIRELIANSEIMRVRRELLDSVPSLGPATIAVILGRVPELGERSTRVLRALIGVAPYNSDSGGTVGQRHIQGGRADVRQALYMAAQTGYRHNPTLKEFYDRLTLRGKCHKQAIVACIGKLISIMNAVIKSGKPYDESRRAA